MVRINLLPWREERRKQRQQQFYMLMGGAVGAGVLASLLIWSYYNGQISGQQDRNAFLDGEIKKVEAQIKDIEELEAKHSALLARKEVIEKLQGDRYKMVHLFDAMMRTVPEGLILTSLKQEGEEMTLAGRAQSNARVASYMRNLESAGWMTNPRVTVIEAAQPQSGAAGAPAAAAGVNNAVPANSVASLLPYMFTMTVTLANPNEPRDPNAPPTPDPIPIQQAPDAVAQPAIAPVSPAPAAPAPAAPVQPAPAAAPASAPQNGTAPAQQEPQS